MRRQSAGSEVLSNALSAARSNAWLLNASAAQISSADGSSSSLAISLSPRNFQGQAMLSPRPACISGLIAVGFLQHLRLYLPVLRLFHVPLQATKETLSTGFASDPSPNLSRSVETICKSSITKFPCMRWAWSDLGLAMIRSVVSATRAISAVVFSHRASTEENSAVAPCNALDNCHR